MAVCGIVSEFDPFHKGHEYLLNTVREKLSPRAVVCVMSGNFTQRGMPAVLDKYTRAELALRGGADLVVELPAVFAMNSADRFAFGGVRTLAALGVVTHLCFGSETGDAALLTAAADVSLEEPQDFKTMLKEGLEKGLSFGTAHARALESFLRPKFADFSGFLASNDILAVEYMKQLKKAGFSLEPVAIPRTGTGHNSTAASGDFASASYIREKLQEAELCTGSFEEGLAAVAPYVPTYTLEALKSRPSADGMRARMLGLLHYKAVLEGPAGFADAPGASEGLENVLCRAILQAGSYSELIDNCRGKRYPASRIQRTLAQALCGVTRREVEAAETQPPYAKVLAFNQAGAGLIKEAREQGTAVIGNPGKDLDDPSSPPAGLAADMRCASVYGILCDKKPYSISDRVNIPKIFRN